MKYARIPGHSLGMGILSQIPVKPKGGSRKCSRPVQSCVNKLSKFGITVPDIMKIRQPNERKKTMPFIPMNDAEEISTNEGGKYNTKKVSKGKNTRAVVDRTNTNLNNTSLDILRKVATSKTKTSVNHTLSDILRKVTTGKTKVNVNPTLPDIPRKAVVGRTILPDILMKTPRKTNINTKVYVLELEHGFIYVGQSTDVQRRVSQHMRGKGAQFTKRYKPTGVLLKRLGTIDGAGDSGERQEVLLQMRKNGMHKVRGWKYVGKVLSRQEVIDVKSNWVEMFNLCRMCMQEGHMASSCRKRKKR